LLHTHRGLNGVLTWENADQSRAKAPELYAQLMPVTANVYERVVKLTNEDQSSSGSGFTLDVADRQYLITSAHVLPPEDPVTVDVLYGGHSSTRTLNRIPGVRDGADIAVLPLDTPLTPTRELPVTASFDRMVYTQDVFFLGYPYGLALRIGGVDRFPFVKKGILSATSETDGVDLIPGWLQQSRLLRRTRRLLRRDDEARSYLRRRLFVPDRTTAGDWR
jgi:S1-C subfamily serine protease